MEKRGHLIFAVVLAFVFLLIIGWLNLNWFNFSLTSVLIMGAITVFYCLLPDIDHKNSTITWWFFGIGVLGLVVGMLGLAFKTSLFNAWTFMIVSAILIVFTYLAVTLFNHRGFIHTVQVGLLSIIPLFFIFHNLAYCALAYVAWHSHLLGDGYIFKFK